MAKKKKEIKNQFKLTIPAGQATPAPPLGPILGQNGINMPEFCSQFNDKTSGMDGEELPVNVVVYSDGSFQMTIKQPTVTGMIKKTLGIEKGSGDPKRNKVGKITNKQLSEIAERKMPDLNTNDKEAAQKIVEGTAKSMGLEIVN